MARIKIKDLPKDQKVSREELKKIFGGDSVIHPIDPIAFNQLMRSPAWRPPTVDPIAFNLYAVPLNWNK